jgi:hypothetical protein
MNSLRKHLSYANIVATLALLFAMSGGALAANHYLINSTKQINPKVLKKLRGNAGKSGASGQAGATGQPGAPGAVGATGHEGARGPSDVYEVELGTSSGALPGHTKALTLANLPAGTYAISGTAFIGPEEQAAGHGQCALHAESDESVGAAELTNVGKAEEAAVISTEITHTFAVTGEVTMRCQVSSITWALSSVGTRIVAIRVDTQHKTTASATE